MTIKSHHYLSAMALATPMVVLFSGPVSAVLLTEPASTNPITVNGTEYNVFFNQNDDSGTSFNDVFGSALSPTLTFATSSDASAAVDAIVASVPISEWEPSSGGSNFSPTSFFLVPYSVSAGLVDSGFGISAGGMAFNGISNRSLRSNPLYDYSYVTFGEATQMPTPALLPGLLGMGAAALRKRRLAQSEEA